jgi:dsDNA-specific endonuclease/ATPase MutS2
MARMTEEKKDIFSDAENRLNTALSGLETQVFQVLDRLEAVKPTEREADALRRDRAKLAIDLDHARARERELQLLADEASNALGAAIKEVREALGKV